MLLFDGICAVGQHFVRHKCQVCPIFRYGLLPRLTWFIRNLIFVQASHPSLLRHLYSLYQRLRHNLRLLPHRIYRCPQRQTVQRLLSQLAVVQRVPLLCPPTSKHVVRPPPLPAIRRPARRAPALIAMLHRLPMLMLLRLLPLS